MRLGLTLSLILSWKTIVIGTGSEAEGIYSGIGCKVAANCVHIESIQELDVLNWNKSCHPIEEGGVTKERVGATERLNFVTMKSNCQQSKKRILGDMLRTIS